MKLKKRTRASAFFFLFFFLSRDKKNQLGRLKHEMLSLVWFLVFRSANRLRLRQSAMLTPSASDFNAPESRLSAPKRHRRRRAACHVLESGDADLLECCRVLVCLTPYLSSHPSGDDGQRTAVTTTDSFSAQRFPTPSLVRTSGEIRVIVLGKQPLHRMRAPHPPRRIPGAASDRSRPPSSGDSSGKIMAGLLPSFPYRPPPPATNREAYGP